MRYSKLFMIIVLATNASVLCMDGKKDLSDSSDEKWVLDDVIKHEPHDQLHPTEWVWKRRPDGCIAEFNWREIRDRLAKQFADLTEQAEPFLNDGDSREAIRGSDAGDSRSLGSPKSTSTDSGDELYMSEELRSTDREQDV